MSTAHRLSSFFPFLTSVLRRTGVLPTTKILASGIKHSGTAAKPVFMVCLSLLVALAPSAFGAAATKQASGTDLTGITAGVWSGGLGVNGSPTNSDIATWTGTSLGPALTLSNSATWGSIAVSGATADIGISGLGTLTNGAISLTNVNLTISNSMALTGSPTWAVGTSGKTLKAAGVISGTGALTLGGVNGGTNLFTALNTYAGGTTVNGGTLALANGGGTGCVTNTLTINPGGIVRLTVQDALGNSSLGTVATPVNILGGTLDNAVNSNNGLDTTFNLMGGNMMSTGGGGYNFNGSSSGINNLATNKVSVISGPVVLRANPVTISAAAGTVPGGIDLVISGAISQSGGTYGITKTGAGVLELTAPNTYAGTTTVNQGTLIIPAGGAINSGSTGSAGVLFIGNLSSFTSTNVGILNISGGTVNSTSTSTISAAGMGTNSVGVVNFSSGNITFGGEFDLGGANAAAPALGVMNLSGGTFVVKTYLSLGRAQNTGGLSRGELNVSGGSLTANNLAVGAFNLAVPPTSVATLSGGTTTVGFSSSVGAQVIISQQANGILNMSGSAILIISNTTQPLVLGQTAGAAGYLNLNGGTLIVPFIMKNAGNGYLNFNGGTLKARTSNASFMTNGCVTGAYVYGGGAIIDDGGNSITIAQPLLAPTGNGVSLGTLAVSGSGFAAPPVVDINDSTGAGTNATAIALIDGNGNLTNVMITCPGVGYTGTPVFNFTSGGGVATQTGSAGTAPSASGGLTKQGSGTLTLSGTNTYTGITIVNAGTLVVKGTVSAGPVTIGNGTLLGNGLIKGPLTNQAAGTLQPGLGTGNTSTLTVSNLVVLAGTNYFTLNRTNTQNSSRLFASGTVTLGGNLTVTNTGDALQAGDSFPLFSAAGFSGSFSATNLPALGNSLFWTNTIAQNGAISVFSTLPPTNAVVTNLPATQIFATSATLSGQVLSTGGQLPSIWIGYGTNDGGTNILSWTNTIALGPKGSSFSSLAAGLATNNTYYFTAFASNSAGIAAASPSFSFTTLAANPSATHVSVLTYHYDNTRQGQNTNETLLTLANVNTNTFGKLFSYAVDGQVYAQPLVMTNVTVPGQGAHDIVFVATENDTIYAFDADSGTAGTNNNGLLWSTHLGIASTNSLSPYGSDYGGGAFGSYGNISTEVGVTATPVIDPKTGTFYVDAFTRELAAGPVTNYIHRIHALDVTTGNEQPNSPVVVAGSVPGAGVDSVGGVMTFNPVQELQRAALALAGGKLFVAYTSYADTDPYHGWVFAYNATNLALAPGIFCATPNATLSDFPVNGKSQAGEGGIWQGGAGLAVDENTNLYFETGNGSFSAFTNGGDYGDAFVKLSTMGSLTVADYFTPYDQSNRAAIDNDLGSGGPTLLPNSVGNGTNLLVGLDKGGKMFVLNRDHLASPNYLTNATSDTNILEEFGATATTFFSSPTYFNGMIYVQAQSAGMKQFSVSNGSVNTTPIATATGFGSGVGGPVVSANGTNDGIVWGINAGNPAVLYAFNATNISQTLYTSSQLASRDNPGNSVKFTSPIVAGGKVYLPGQYTLTVYGVQVFLDAPIISPNSTSFTSAITITLSDASAGASIYYTLDGTMPTASSTLYAGPFTLTSNAVVQAVAIAPGSVNSAVTSTSFVNTAAAGNGTGLKAQYFTNATSASPFSGSPALVTTNPTVNFSSISNWPGALVGTTNFTVRWTGSVQAQFNENYSFITTADDGARLYLNGQLLIDDWVDKTGATSKTNSITLVAQQYYSIELDYYQKTNNASVTLAWSSPSTPFSVIPQTQLYPFTNPPPSVVLLAPFSGASYTASASVTMSADADAPHNPISAVSFFANNAFLGSVSNVPYTLTATGLPAGGYTLTAVATDGSGLSSTSAVVSVTVNPGSGQPYGLTSNAPVHAFLNMPTLSSGSLPAQLSLTGVFSNTPAMIPTNGLIPYDVNTPLWSDGALKTRYLAVPNHGSPLTPDEQITFDPNYPWSFQPGTVFVKTFELNTDTTNPNVRRRLETRLLVRDINGAVYGVTYKWRADNSDADLLASSLTENITITNASGSTTQTWYYPSPSDCLTCHTTVSGGVLGVNARQLNRTLTYTATGVTDNELRTLNRLGLFNPAFNESAIAGYPQLASITNLSASLEQRARSYFDANCSQCHQPGGAGITFDARYSTPLANQNLINGGLDENGFAMIVPGDIYRSEIPPRMNTTNTAIKMPPLARNLIDSNAVQVINAWIGSMPGSPVHFVSAAYANNQQFQMSFLGVPGSNYVLQASTNLSTWVPVSTNTATLNPFLLIDPNATNFPDRYYRAMQQ